jgi:hypothetical protein
MVISFADEQEAIREMVALRAQGKALRAIAAATSALSCSQAGQDCREGHSATRNTSHLVDNRKGV